MIIIRTAEAFARLLVTHPDTELKTLLQAQADRLAEYEDFALEDLAMFVIVEPNDNLDEVLSLADLTSAELIKQQGGWQEVTIILSDDGYGLVLYVPNDADPQILAACQHALATSTTSSRTL